jgi:SAM-dependent methyltransferase
MNLIVTRSVLSTDDIYLDVTSKMSDTIRDDCLYLFEGTCFDSVGFYSKVPVYMTISYILYGIEFTKKYLVIDKILQSTICIGYPNRDVDLPSRINNPSMYISLLVNKSCLEIGGPSYLFDDFIPVYKNVASIDNLIFKKDTLWNSVRSDCNIIDNVIRGKNIIADAVDLSAVNTKYDCIVSSHCLEHIANPIKALFEWKRVLNPNGCVVIIVPWKYVIFDRARPHTTFEHIMEDFNNDVGEDDLTHLVEIVELHDISLDPPAKNKELFHQRCLLNMENRGMHHHIFNFNTLFNMLKFVGLKVVEAELLSAFNLVIMATNS